MVTIDNVEQVLYLFKRISITNATCVYYFQTIDINAMKKMRIRDERNSKIRNYMLIRYNIYHF